MLQKKRNMTSSQLFVSFPPNNLPQSTSDKMYFINKYKKCRRNWIRFNKLVDRGSEMEIAVIHARWSKKKLKWKITCEKYLNAFISHIIKKIYCMISRWSLFCWHRREAAANDKRFNFPTHAYVHDWMRWNEWEWVRNHRKLNAITCEKCNNYVRFWDCNECKAPINWWDEETKDLEQ